MLTQYGETVVPPRTGKRGRPRKPYKQWPPHSVYATVQKTYAKGRVSVIDRTLVYGAQEDLTRALAGSTRSTTVNTSFIERHNGTDRNYNARKVRATYEFSKSLLEHVAITWWVVLCYNFHHLHRGLRVRLDDKTCQHRTPAMAAGLAQRPMTISAILATQVVGFAPTGRITLENFNIRTATEHVP